MIGPRIPEPCSDAMGREHAAEYDRMQAALRADGFLETGALLEAGIVRGRVLEIGSGPGHLGLDWLSRTEGTTLVGLDLSPEMIATAEGHAREEGLSGRASYVLAAAEAVPFPSGSFDAVFSANSLHEWVDPRVVLVELRRVLTPGGPLFLSDLRRDLPAGARGFLEARMSSAAVREGLRASVGAAYTAAEARGLAEEAGFAAVTVRETPVGLRVTAAAPA